MGDSDVVKLRSSLKKTFTDTGIYFTKDSISYLTELVKNAKPDARQPLIARLIKAIQNESIQADLIDITTLKETIKRTLFNKNNNGEAFVLENINEWKPVAFDKYSKKFCVAERMTLWNKPAFEVLRHRFEHLQELLADDADYQTSIESLFSCNNINVCVLGMLTRGTKDELLAEDLSGTVQLNLSEAEYDPALYFEGGIFEFQGVHSAGKLNVKHVALPRLKSNFLSTEIGGDSVPVNVGWSRNPNDRIVFLSDVLLDEPRVLKAIYQILSGFASCPPNAFVICGKFLQTQLAYGYTEQARNVFHYLANIFSEFSAQFVDTKFVLMPSLDDPLPVNVLPCFALPPSIKDCFVGLKNVLFATNPCRIHFKGQKILVCRDDLVEKLCRVSIHVPPNAKDIPEHFCDTIWSQRHISPLPLHFNPILPNFDYLFYLWPAPDVLVIADKYKSFNKPETEFRRLTINPGSFLLNNFEFLVFYPALKKVEASILHVD